MPFQFFSGIPGTVRTVPGRTELAIVQVIAQAKKISGHGKTVGGKPAYGRLLMELAVRQHYERLAKNARKLEETAKEGVLAHTTLEKLQQREIERRQKMISTNAMFSVLLSEV